MDSYSTQTSTRSAVHTPRSGSSSPIHSRSPSPSSTAASSQISYSDAPSPFFATSTSDNLSTSTKSVTTEASSRNEKVENTGDVKPGEQPSEQLGMTGKKGFVLHGPGDSKTAEELPSFRSFSSNTILKGPSSSYARRFNVDAARH
ncbi:hypothetical protein LIPSTDRAFT_107377 [Lipomyces starkeyi NRRL Y-11557]|uniref:Uncharacterized protein n=1 Tax=Lipomyces starkeyi NRRL Y-11557 TaxID=675824 RepID=A0A1E3PXW2_LIPST|nr:hypothetical protein LIPSTDRAFT_107377 [Lipomyces starkeyi NRRL Y-11557]